MTRSCCCGVSGSWTLRNASSLCFLQVWVKYSAVSFFGGHPMKINMTLLTALDQMRCTQFLHHMVISLKFMFVTLILRLRGVFLLPCYSDLELIIFMLMLLREPSLAQFKSKLLLLKILFPPIVLSHQFSIDMTPNVIILLSLQYSLTAPSTPHSTGHCFSSYIHYICLGWNTEQLAA